MVPSCVVDKIGKKSIRVRSTNSEKRRITSVLACTANGKMLPPMVIFKGTTTRSIKNVEAGSENSIVSFQKKAWVDESQMLKWMQKVWVNYTKRRHSLLFLDSFSAHLTSAVQSAFADANRVIPGGCTSVLQPLVM